MDPREAPRHSGGRPRKQPEACMVRRTIWLPKEAIAFYEAIGQGNLADGIRRAWRREAFDPDPEENK